MKVRRKKSPVGEHFAGAAPNANDRTHMRRKGFSKYGEQRVRTTEQTREQAW